MSPRATSLLSGIFSAANQPRRGALSDFAPVKADAANLAPSLQRRRTMIWDLHHSMHCSVIGTCLSTSELRRVLVKVNAIGAEAADDHDLHMLGVMLAGRPDAGAKVLQKALDRRHEIHIKQFSRAKDAEALTAMWDDALKRGDIPGAYWALLTHPTATDDLAKRVFGDVHMLSHLVGASNRADIRRLRILEEEKAALTTKVERQQRQLREGFVERDATIRRLNEMLARTIARVDADDGDEYFCATRGAMAELERRLDREILRRERLEQRLAILTGALKSAEHERDRAKHESQILSKELTGIEARTERLFADDGATPTNELNLSGLTALYVGGRANQLPQFRALVERAGGNFLHHDGGIEHSAALLPGLISRANWILFPIDCVSHDAMSVIKRVCKQSGKPYIPLRTSSLTCLFSGLADLVSMEDQSLPKHASNG
jgi:hypothetical protein